MYMWIDRSAWITPKFIQLDYRSTYRCDIPKRMLAHLGDGAVSVGGLCSV